MKATDIIVPIGSLAAVALAVCLVLEHHAVQELNAQNDALRRQLSTMAALTAENRRLTDLLAQAGAPHAHPTTGTDERLVELAQLRNQVAAFHQQSNDVETVRSDTAATRAALVEAHQALSARRLANHPHPGPAPDAPFAVLQASYGTDRTNLDVVAELNDRIRSDSLKFVANNNLSGDPDFGHVKSLTVVYRFNGVIQTNQFSEGNVVILPPPDQ